MKVGILGAGGIAVKMAKTIAEMDGVETTKAIRSVIGNESAIIILTAYKWDEVLDDAVKAGVDSFIAKPLFANSVIEEFKNAENKNDKEMEFGDILFSLVNLRIFFRITFLFLSSTTSQPLSWLFK